MFRVRVFDEAWVNRAAAHSAQLALAELQLKVFQLAPVSK